MKPDGSTHEMRRLAALPPVFVAVAHTSWPKLNSLSGVTQVLSNVAIDGVGVAWGINANGAIALRAESKDSREALVDKTEFAARSTGFPAEALW
jgi:hypothetical protein